MKTTEKKTERQSMPFLKEWFHNLYITVLAFIGVFIFMFIFMKIFYPDTISVFVLMGQFGVLLANSLKLWPLIVLAVIVSAMPRRRRKR